MQVFKPNIFLIFLVTVDLGLSRDNDNIILKLSEFGGGSCFLCSATSTSLSNILYLRQINSCKNVRI